MIVRQVRDAVRRLGGEGRSILVAVSGGIDSVSLLHLLLAVKDELDLDLAIGHVNHGLRGEESEGDEGAVRALARATGLPVRVEVADPAPLRLDRSSRDRPTLQEAARELRYGALYRIAGELECHHIATAHNADDQAETVLLRLFRGTGPDGLGGIPERSRDGRILRPLLRVERNEIEAFVDERGIPFREDSSNASDAYARNRLRRHWLPGLVGDFNPRLLRAIGGLAEAQQQDAEWIASLVEREAWVRFSMEGDWLRIDEKDWTSLPRALSLRLARSALERCGGARHTSRVHLNRMVEFLCNARPRTAIELPGDLRLSRSGTPGGGFRLGPGPAGGRS
jgi:tRNA(Ile)-lysidine synthase